MNPVDAHDNKYNIRVLVRAMQVLSTLSDANPRTLTEISTELGLNSSTVFRILSTLASKNYVEKNNKTGEYRLGIGVLELTSAYFDGNDLRHNAIDELEKLRDLSSETVHLGTLDNMQVVYIEKLHGLHAVGLMSSHVGGRSPSYCTGLGKVLLAYIDEELVRQHFLKTGLEKYTSSTIVDLDELMRHLEEIRNAGYSLDEGEHEQEVRCIAAPIFDIKKSIVAAVSVSGPATRLHPIKDQQFLIEETVSRARRISSKLGLNSSPRSFKS